MTHDASGLDRPPDHSSQAQRERERLVRRFVSQVGWLLLMRYALIGAAAWGFAWGTAVLVLRVATDAPLAWLLAGAAGLAGVVLGAAVLAWRNRPTAARVRALVDERSRCGGLLMVEAELDVGAWAERVPAVQLPRLRWRGGRIGALAAAAGLYVLASFLVPTDFSARAASVPLDISAQAQAIREQMVVLEEEQILLREEAATLEEKLAQVQEQARGESPVKTWEALDHLEQRLSQEAAEAAELALQRTGQIAAAQELVEALSTDEAQSSLSPASMNEAMTQLAQLTQQAMAETDLLDAELSAMLEQAMGDGADGRPLPPEQLARLAEALKGRKMQVQARIARLAEARLIDPKMLDQSQRMGQHDSEGLRQFLAECESAGMSVSAAVQQWGRGGVNRGRGDAPMTWQQQASSEEGVTFEAQALPLMALEAMKQSQLVGVSTGAPTQAAEAPAVGRGALDGAAVDGGSAARQIVLPQHRAAVQRYFERE